MERRARERLGEPGRHDRSYVPERWESLENDEGDKVERIANSLSVRG